MSRFLALIVAAAVALFIAGPAMAEHLTVTKTVTNSNTANTTFDTDIDVDKDVFINISSGEEPIPAEGLVNVSGDSIFKELDVNVQDQEAVVKFFELDDSATSTWTITGTGVMNVAEQLQNGFENTADIDQNARLSTLAQMNVGLQYQVGSLNSATISQESAGTPDNPVDTNNFAKQIQIGEGNIATILQNF